MDDIEWQTYLEGYQYTNYEHMARWNLIRKFIIEYKKQLKDRNGTLEWGEPLCDLELCTTSVGDNITTNIHSEGNERKFGHWAHDGPKVLVSTRNTIDNENIDDQDKNPKDKL